MVMLKVASDVAVCCCRKQILRERERKANHTRLDTTSE